MTDLIGTELGNYRIVEEIGRGGMAVVYKAYQSSLDRWLAIKVLREQWSEEKAVVERFHREARAAAKLQHPNIIHIYDVAQQGHLYYIVMDYVAGGTLAARLAREGALDAAAALSVMGQIGSALDYAHAQGIVHRDVKPGNILLTVQGQAILSDFGIARAAAEARLTRTGTLVGTPEYMSPEQAAGETGDGRSDLYSLGVVLYEMLTGRVPFQADTPVAVLYKQVHASPPAPSGINAAISGPVERVLLHALHKDRDKRYRTAAEMTEALTQAANRPSGEGPHSTVPTVSKRGWAWVFLVFLFLAAVTMAWLGRECRGPLAMLLCVASPAPTRTYPATRTRTLTPTATVASMPTSTPVPTASPGPTNTREPSSTPVRTPTPGPVAVPTVAALSAPALEAPASGAGLSGETITLRWRWDRALQENEYFDVRAWREGQPAYGIAWAKETFCAVRGLAPGKYYWSILVLRHTGTQPDGAKEWEPVSPESEVWWFTYSPVTPPTETPIPPPTFTPRPPPTRTPVPRPTNTPVPPYPPPPTFTPRPYP